MLASTKPVNCPKGEHSALVAEQTGLLNIPLANLCSVLHMLLASYYAFHWACSNAFHFFLQEFMLGDLTGIKRTSKYMVFINRYKFPAVKGFSSL